MPGLQLVIELDDKGAISKVTTLDKAYDKFTGGMGAKAAKAASAMKRIQDSTHALQASIQKLSIVGGVSLGALTGKMVHTGMQFEQSLANVRAASHATAAEIKEMESIVRHYGSTTVFSSKQVSDAWLQLIKGGMNMSQVKDTIGKALLFAGASGMQLADTINYLDDMMDTFQVQAADSGKLVQTLLGAMSVTPIEALMEAMRGAGTVAAELGVEYQDLIAHFTILEARGMSGSKAGMAYAMMLNALLNPTAEAKAALGGMVFTGTNLNEVLDHLRESGMDAKKAIEVFGGGLRAPGTLIAKLLTATKEEMAAVEVAFNDTAKAQAAFDARMDTTSSKMTIFKNAIDEKMIAVFEKMKPAVSDAMEALKEAFDSATPAILKQAEKIGEWMKNHTDLIADVVVAIPKIMLYALAFQALAAGIGAVSTAGKILIPVMSLLAAHPVFAAISAGYLLAVSYDKLMRGFGIGNPLQALVDKFAELRDRTGEAKTKLFEYSQELETKFGTAGGTVMGVDVNGIMSRIAGDRAAATMGTPPAATGGVPPGTGKAAASGGGSKAAAGPGYDWAALSAQAHIYDADRQAAFELQSALSAMKNDEIKAGYLDVIRESSAADSAWLDAKIGLAAMERDAVIGNAAEMAQARIDYDTAVMDAELEHADAVWYKWQENNQGMMALFAGLEAGYDTMIDSAIDSEMTGKQRREAIWDSMKLSFLRSAGDMLKKELKLKIQNWLLAEGARKPFDLREKFTAAKMGAVKAYQAFAGIPIIGPALGMVAAASAFAFLMAFHKGGMVGSDERVIKVQTDEFIMQRSAVRGIGRGNMEYMNATGRMPSGGGSIGPFVFNISAGDKETADGIAAFIDEKVVPMLENAIGRRKFSLEGEM